MSLRLSSARKGRFEPLIENFYGQLFRAQMNKDWKDADRIQGLIANLETRESQMAENTQDLRDYEGSVR